MKSKNIIRLIFTSLFWIVIYILIKSQMFETDKNPYIMVIVFVVFIGHILYEGIYLKNKVENKKNKLKSKQLTILKSNKTVYIPKIYNELLPAELTNYIPIFKKWGIENKMLREDLIEHANQDELLELKSIEIKREIIETWLQNNSENIVTSNAIKLTLKAYDDLGLWTWKT